MVRRNRSYFISAIVILAILIVVSFIYLGADKSKANLPQLSVDLAFCGTIGIMAALALALVAVGYSIKEADISIFLGDKNVTTKSVLQEVRVRNRGNALGNMAHAFVEVEVLQSSPISFTGAAGLNFQPIQNTSRKQYRLDDPLNPKDLYPAEYIWRLLGFIQVPSGITGHVKFSVQIVGTQGCKRREFDISI